MKCPACGLYHPAFYERCVACGVAFLDSSAVKSGSTEINNAGISDSHGEEMKQSLTRIRFGPNKILARNKQDTGEYDLQNDDQDSENHKDDRVAFPVNKIFSSWANFKQIPTKVGIVLTVSIFFVCAGVTAFFLSKSPDDQHLVDLGKHQLALGQYAFAVQTLSKATALRSNDPQAFLALARAYIGVDQIDQAWDCIVHAQQLGAGVVAEPTLASELANYYRQHGQYDKAIDLLRPLANASISGKRAELADMDALRGDECLEKDNLEQARLCWEEVQALHEGSRFSEAQARLSTIYTKSANLAYSNGEDDKALDFISKLNSIGENSRNYLLAADIYERDGKLDQATQQVQKALKLSPDDQFAKNRLAELLSKHGKELINAGDESGYDYLKQAKTIDGAVKIPVVTLKNLKCKIDLVSKKPVLSGQIWNESDKSVDALTMRVELYDIAKEKVLWSQDAHIIDEFVTPLAPQETKSFSFSAPSVEKGENNLSFKVYLDNSFYEAYPLKSSLADAPNSQSENKDEQQTNSNVSGTQSTPPDEQAEHKENNPAQEVEKAKGVGESSLDLNRQSGRELKDSVSPEEKTIKDLDY